MGSTTIEWTDWTWNPLRGCARVSEGCRHCYAERQAARFAGPGQPFHGHVERTEAGPRWTGKVSLVESLLDAPLRRRKPSRIFVNSMSDLFHESVPDEWIDRVFAVMALAPRHTFQVLTKRAARMRKYVMRFDWERVVSPEALAFERRGGDPDATHVTAWPLPNVWLGASVEDQARADERIPELLATPAAVRFVSAEPLLGPVDFTRWVPGSSPGISWIIAGGESGPGARPMHPDWVRGVRDQCAAAGVPFFFKQWGAWRPIYYARPPEAGESGPVGVLKVVDDRRETLIGGPRADAPYEGLPAVNMIREARGKKAAGAALDGIEHRAFPAGRGGS